jgi:TolA-binding protein
MHSAVEVRPATTTMAIACAPAILIMLATPACMTAREAAGLRGEAAGVQVRLDDLERREEEHRDQMIELRQVLDRATALLAANSAGAGAKEAKAESDIAALQAKVDQMSQASELGARQRAENENRLETRMAVLEGREAKIAERVAPLLLDKEQLWQQAGAQLKSDQKDQGRHLYRVFIQRFPQDPRASRAYLEIGRSFAADQQFAQAAAEFQRLLDTYPQSPEVPDAMWQLSMTFVQLRFCTDAHTLLGDLVKRYPKSTPAPDAEKEIEAIEKVSKNHHKKQSQDACPS